MHRFQVCSGIYEDSLTWSCLVNGLLGMHNDIGSQGFGGKSILGPLRQGQKEEPNITRLACHYRCQCCRKRVAVSAGNPLFEGSGAGQHSMSLTVLAFWNCVEGVSITHTVKQLAVDEKVVSRLVGCI